VGAWVDAIEDPGTESAGGIPARTEDTHAMTTPAKLPLPDLAARINSEHAACLASAKDAILRAIEVGRLLAEAKGRVRHGEWAGWVEANCSFGIRQAQCYMRAHHNRGALEEQMRSGASHLTGLHGAIAALASPRDVEGEGDEGDHVRLEDLEDIKLLRQGAEPLPDDLVLLMEAAGLQDKALGLFKAIGGPPGPIDDAHDAWVLAGWKAAKRGHDLFGDTVELLCRVTLRMGERKAARGRPIVAIDDLEAESQYCREVITTCERIGRNTAELGIQGRRSIGLLRDEMRRAVEAPPEGAEDTPSTPTEAAASKGEDDGNKSPPPPAAGAGEPSSQAMRRGPRDVRAGDSWLSWHPKDREGGGGGA
jgi:hypothetical protein